MTRTLDSDLRTWVESVCGRRVTDATPAFGGGTRHTWFIELDDPEADRLVARVESGRSAFAGTELTLAREAVVYRALNGTDVRLPRLYGEHPSGTALLLQRLPGTADLRKFDADELDAVFDDFVDQLALLHGLDVRRLELPGLPRPETAEDHALQDLDLWRRLSTRCGALDPEIAFGLAWLENNAPASVPRTALVQGDTGPGNFVAQDGRVSGLIDWEFAHLGDPVDDIAWLRFRIEGWEKDGNSRFPDLLARYEKAGGITVEPASLEYYSAFVHLRCAVTTALTIQGGGNHGLATYLAYHRRFLRSLVEHIASAESLEEPKAMPAPGPTARTPFYDRALAEVETVLAPTLRSSDQKLAAREIAMLLRYLRNADQRALTVEENDRAELRDIMGPGHEDPAALSQAAAEAGRTGDQEFLRFLVRRSRRQESLWEGVVTR